MKIDKSVKNKWFIEQTAKDYDMSYEQVKRIFIASESDEEFYMRLEYLHTNRSYELK